MAEKLPLNATFFAFQKRDRGGVLFGASVVYVVLTIAMFGGFIALNWQAIADYAAWTVSVSQQNPATADPNDPFAGMMPPPSVMTLGGAYALFLIVFYLLLAAYEAACLRWMIRGETKGFFGFALDGDTWRVYFTYWLWMLLFMGFYLVMLLVMGGLIAGLAIGGGGQGDPSAMASMGIGVFAAICVVLLLLAYFGVRFAPAAATSVAKRRFAFFDAWTVTKGRFWALLGSFVLLWLMYFVGLAIVYGAAIFIVGPSLFAHAASADAAPTEQEMLAMVSAPGVWIPLAIAYAVAIVGMFMFYVALFGINARAAQAALEEGKITAAQT